VSNTNTLLPIQSRNPDYAEIAEALSIAINQWMNVACMETELERWQVAANLLPTLLGTIAEALDEERMQYAADHSLAIVREYRSHRHLADLNKLFSPSIQIGKSSWGGDVRF
jgi:hypothetical protein